MKKLLPALLVLLALSLLSGCVFYTYRKMPPDMTLRKNVRLEDFAGEYKSLKPAYPVLGNTLVKQLNLIAKSKNDQLVVSVRILPENGNLRMQALDKDRKIVDERVLLNGKDFTILPNALRLECLSREHRRDYPHEGPGMMTDSHDYLLCLTQDDKLVIRINDLKLGILLIVPTYYGDKDFYIYDRVTAPTTKP